MLMQHPVKEHERRNALIGSAMDKHAPTVESIHDSAKRAEILGSRSFEIHRNMQVRHAEAGDDTPLVSKSVIGCREREVDDRLKTRLANRPKLMLVRLANGSQR